MKRITLSIFIYTLFCSFGHAAEETAPDISLEETLKMLYKDFKIKKGQRKKGILFETDQKDDFTVNACTTCPAHQLLGEEVSRILSHYAEEQRDDTGPMPLDSETKKLEAMVYLSHVAKMSEESPLCYDSFLRAQVFDSEDAQ